MSGEGNGNPLQYSCLENPVDRGAWWAAVHGVARSRTRLKRLSMHACIGGGNGNPLQCSCLETPRDGGAWWAAVYGVAQSRTRLKQLSMHACFGEGNGNPLQYSCLENPRDGGAWWAAVYGVAQSWTRLTQLSSSSSRRLVITFLPRSKCLLISWLQSPSAVILDPRKIKSATVFNVSPSIHHEVMGPDAMIFVF